MSCLATCSIDILSVGAEDEQRRQMVLSELPGRCLDMSQPFRSSDRPPYIVSMLGTVVEERFPELVKTFGCKTPGCSTANTTELEDRGSRLASSCRCHCLSMPSQEQQYVHLFTGDTRTYHLHSCDDWRDLEREARNDAAGDIDRLRVAGKINTCSPAEDVAHEREVPARTSSSRLLLSIGDVLADHSGRALRVAG